MTQREVLTHSCFSLDQFAPPQQAAYGAPAPGGPQGQGPAAPAAGGDPAAAMAAWQAQYGAQWAACESFPPRTLRLCFFFQHIVVEGLGEN